MADHPPKPKVRRRRMNEKKLADAILSASMESVVATDDSGRILLLNPSAERLFDVHSKNVKGKSFLEVLRHSGLVDMLSETLRRGEALNREMTLYAPTERTLTVHARPLEFGEERPGILMAIRDITELRRLATLRQEFVANVSHELKTPLTSIKGFVETLLDGALDDKKLGREFLETIQQHVENLTVLIDDLLDLSRIEAKRMDYRLGPVQVDDVVTRIIKALEPLAKAKKVLIKSTLTNGLPHVLADRNKLAQIFMNLIDNAIKFNRIDGQIEISALYQPAGHLTVAVADTGPGIDPRDLPRVFERFFRGDRAHSHEIKGTGLGLAIVKHLTEAQQGSVQVESVLEKGSIFRVILPLASS